MLSTSSAQETQSIARDFAAHISADLLPVTIWLNGEIGSGKTTFAQGMIRAMGWSGRVKSPTYSLVESYNTTQALVFHFDLYRVKGAEELENIGVRDYFSRTSLRLIEWADLMHAALPLPDMLLYFTYRHYPDAGEADREIAVIGKSTVGKALAARMK